MDTNSFSFIFRSKHVFLSSDFQQMHWLGFEYLAIILGTDFGSIISLGIGPIEVASIIPQLLTGSGVVSIDTTTDEGKKFFQGIQKILVFFFIIFEALVYVLMQGLPRFLICMVVDSSIPFQEAWQFFTWMNSQQNGDSVLVLACLQGQEFHGVIMTGAFQFIDQQGRNCCWI